MSSSSSEYANPKLAGLLRECATYVARGSFHPNLYHALSELHTYTGKVSARPSGNTTATASNTNARPSTPSNNTNGHPNGSNDDAAKGVNLRGMNSNSSTSADEAIRIARNVFNDDSSVHSKHNTTKTSGLENVFTSSNSSSQSAQKAHSVAGTSNGHNISNLFSKLKFPSGDSSSSATKTGTTGSAANAAGGNGEGEWCDEHFTLGCMCKVRGNQQMMGSNGNSSSTNSSTNKTPRRPSFQRSQQQETAKPISRSNSKEYSNQQKPSFQRPANPKSNILASGWVEVQKRVLMRINWKDVLISLVDGKKTEQGLSPATFWVQKSENDKASGFPELKVLHQIPVTWMDDVSSLSVNGEHKFSIKVRGNADELQFRCKDADSMTNWAATLLSCKEAAVKRPTRMAAQTNQQPSAPSQPVRSQPAPAPQHQQSSNTTNQPKMSIRDLRAIAHGEGINTSGMERKDLERIAAHVASRRPPPPSSAATPQRAPAPAPQQAQPQTPQANSVAQEQERQRLQQQQKREQQEAEERRRKINEQRAAEDRRRQEQKLAEQKMAEERRRQALLQAQKEAEQRAAAVEQQRRRQAEQQAAELRRKQAEQQAAEARQKWQQQQQRNQFESMRFGGAPQQHQQQGNVPNNPQFFSRQQQQQNAAPPPPRNANPGSPKIQEKYRQSLRNLNAVDDDEDKQQESITALKRNMLVHWALNPPAMTSLKSIDVLISSIHTCFPPAFGVQGHAYFSKWKSIPVTDLRGAGNSMLDEKKLEKSVKKLKFFLHPDKLPRDLDAQQAFMCKMLWDVIADADEEYRSKRDQLDWIR